MHFSIKKSRFNNEKYLLEKKTKEMLEASTYIIINFAALNMDLYHYTTTTFAAYTTDLFHLYIFLVYKWNE